MHRDLKQRLDQFIEVYKYAGIHASKKYEVDKLGDLKDDLVEGIIKLATDATENQHPSTFEDAAKVFVAIGNAMAIECAKYFNDAKIPYYQPFEITPSGPPVELDSRFFLITFTQLPPEQLRPFIPILEDYFVLDRFEHPDYIGPDLSIITKKKKKEEGVADQVIENLTPMEDIPDEKVLPEYFKAFEEIKTYITSGNYDDPNAKVLYDRMNMLQSRIVNLK